MLVIGNNIRGIGSKSAIDKFIVIRVGLNQFQMVTRVYKLYRRTFREEAYNIISNLIRGLMRNNFSILCDNIIRYT